MFMDIAQTIDTAVKIVGSQRRLAELLQIPESNISGFKKGRPCSYQKHAEIAAAAGMEEEARHILIQGMADSLRDDLEHEAQAKAGLLAMLKAFPNSIYENQQIKRLFFRALRSFCNVFAEHRVASCVDLPVALI